ncbi:MAG: SDR family oxidoreductase [Steroidobacteraceae bacterium]|nr:SDR family oxidoreductase [Steroidobacteraceae bacterium]
MDLQLRGLSAVVTGGSAGIGKEIVRTLAGEGCNVHFCARGRERIATTLAELRGLPGTVEGESVDVADPEAVTRWLAAVGRFDILVANVSALADDWRTTLRVDLEGTVHVTETAIPVLQGSAHAAITFIGSKTASYEAPHSPSYGASKAAMAHYMKSLSSRLLPTVRVNVVSPGDILFDGGYWDGVRRRDPAGFARTVQRNRMGRFGAPDEVARVVAFISSPAAAFVSGANWYVDGGSVAQVQF